MKRSIIFLLAGLIIATGIKAQEKLNAITTPSSPASYILGVQPDAVLTPKSYRALEAALYSNFFSGGEALSIPRDFALEFTPYWTKNHGLSLDEYLYPKSIWDQVLRNSSVSISSTQNFLLGDSSASNGIAYGYRTTIYLGNKKDREIVTAYLEVINQNKAISARIISKASELILIDEIKSKAEFIERMRPVIEAEVSVYFQPETARQIIGEIMNEVQLLPDNPVSGDPLPDSFLDAFNPIITNSINKQLKYDAISDFRNYIGERQGFMLDIAYAGLVNFPTNSFGYSVVPRQSIWLTPTYRFKDKLSKLKVMGVLRYEWYRLEYYNRFFPSSDFFKNNFDYGLAVSGEWRKFSIRFEVVGRSSNSETVVGQDENGNNLYIKDNSSDVQYMGTFSYRLTDEIALTYTLGEKFNPILNPEETLVSLLSLNFGFGAPTTNDIEVIKDK